MTFWNNINYKIAALQSRLVLLIGVNIVVYLAVNVPAIIEWLFFRSDNIAAFSKYYLSLPASLPQLLHRFWTPVTYMFMHDRIFHILFNMLWLYWFGQIFEEFLGKKRTVGLYLLGGLAGGALFIAAYNIFPAFADVRNGSTVVGASASVMAIVVGAATIAPNYTIMLFFLGPVKLKWIALFYVVIDFLSISGANAGGEIAHLGGAMLGFFYVRQVQKGNDWIAGIVSIFKKKPHLKVASTNRDKAMSSRPRQDEVDAILDKISKSGYENLSKHEKEVLFRASKHEES